MDFKLELIQVPVSDVERAKAFYADKVGFTLDMDAAPGDGVRFIQLTPPGSPASIAIGTGLTTMKPGTMEGLQLVVADIHAAGAPVVATLQLQNGGWVTREGDRVRNFVVGLLP